MKNFEYYNPVRILFGPGEVEKIGAEAGKWGKKVCLVSYKNVDFLRLLLERIKSLLEKEGIRVFSFFQVEENPDIRTVEAGVKFCKDEGVDLVVGVGGGSAMDAAKAIAAGVYYEGDLWNMVFSRHSAVSAVPPEKSLPTVMVPTLPATGSEMNLCAVVSNRKLQEKSYIWSPCLYPKTSIIDPELTVTLPPFQTACAAADTISHVLEIYLNGEEDSDLQHYFQEGVMRTVIDNVEKALAEPDNISARSHLQWAATCAINGWASPGDAWTPIHQIGHVLTALYKIPHGASLSILMPAWMTVMHTRRMNRYYRFATRVMEINPSGKSEKRVVIEGIEAFRVFLKKIGAPVSFREMRVTDPDIDRIVENVVKVSFNAEGYLTCNPPVSREDIAEVLKKAL